MTETSPTGVFHRRELLRSALACAAGLASRPAGAVPALASVRPTPEAPEAPPLPRGVLARYGSPGFRSPSAVSPDISP